MPSRPSSPRRPSSGRGTPARPGAPRSGSAGRSARPYDRDDRRGSTRATGSARPRRDDDRPARPYDRDDRRGAPRGTGAARPARPRRDDDRPARPYDRDERRGAPRGTGAARPARPRRDDDRPARPYDRDDRRGAPRGTGAARPARPRRDDERSSRPYDRDARDSARGTAARRGETPRPAPARGLRNGGERARNAGATRRPQRTYEPTPEEIERTRSENYAKAKGWGGVARRGASGMKSEGPAMEATASKLRAPAPLDEWVEETRPARSAAAAKAKGKSKAPYALPGDVAADIRKAFLGTAYQREKMVHTLTKAAEAYDRKRYEEALRLGRIVADAVPGVAAVRELTGLASYRAERWNMAKIHLRTHFELTGDPEHLPLVMDCDRANRRYRAVEKVFGELEGAEPTAEVLTEGRIVLAAAWADQRKFTEAIDLLTRAGGTKKLANPNFRHVRLWYALADIFDRAGDAPAARELFARIVVADPDAYDARERLAELGSNEPRKQRKRRATPVSKKKVD